jgi:hypothetical protein
MAWEVRQALQFERTTLIYQQKSVLLNTPLLRLRTIETNLYNAQIDTRIE